MTINAWLNRKFDLVISEHILDGLRRAWSKSYFTARLNLDRQRRAERLLRRRAILVVPQPIIPAVADDEEDDLVLATAVAGSATHLVTGDRGLLRLGSYQGITILPPREFLDMLTAPGTTSPTS